MTKTQSIQNLITATIEAKTTEELLTMHLMLTGPQDPTGRQMRGTIADAITNRLGLNDAIEDIMFGDDDNMFDGTYHEAIVMAMARVAA